MNLYLRLLLLNLRCRRRPRLSAWDTARTPFRVSPGDLDLLGHMNNGRYLTLMDLGRMDLMIRAGVWKRLKKNGWYPVVAGQTITYLRSLVLGQEFDLYSRILGADEKYGYVEQLFCVGEKVHAKAVVRARFLSKKGGKVDPAEVLGLMDPNHAQEELPRWVREWTAASVTEKEFRSPTAD